MNNKKELLYPLVTRALREHRVEFSASVPFERFTVLKAMVENRKRWKQIDSQWSYFETAWKPNSWNDRLRFIFTLCAMMAHNLSREVQMLAAPALARTRPKRPAAWAFEKLDTLRHRIIQRAGRLTRPQGQLTLTMSANEAVRKDLLHFLDVLQKAA